MPRLAPLPAARCRLVVDPADLPFDSTRELEPLETVVGQTKAIEAIEFALGVDDPRYNLFVAGPPGTGKTSLLPAMARKWAGRLPTPPDWCYVHNFDDPHRPRAISLAPGLGRAFATELRRLVEYLRKNVPLALSSRDYRGKQRTLIGQTLDERRSLFEQLESTAKTHGFAVEETAQSVQLHPLGEDGRPIPMELRDALDDEHRKLLEDNERALRNDVLEYLDRSRSVQDDADNAMDRLDRDTVGRLLSPRLTRIRKKFNGTPVIEAWLRQLADDILDNLDAFLPPDPEDPSIGDRLRGNERLTERWEVNVLVDHAESSGGPVILEYNPTVANLVGRVERRLSFGALETSHTMIRPGAILRASGGILIVRVGELLQNQHAWSALKRCMRENRCDIEESDDETGPNATATLKPEAIPFRTKFILIGNLDEYLTLRDADEEFAKLFKVRADFDTAAPLVPAQVMELARFLAARSRKAGLPPFTRTGVAAMCEQASRLAGRQDELSLRMTALADLALESAHWARLRGAELVSREDVEQAVEKRRTRENLYHERVLLDFRRKTLLVELQGSRIGQINGLFVLEMGELSFGLPGRITAKTFAGTSGLVNIERETELSGQIHSKAVLILTGYLGSTYAQERPLALTASITFEQNYTPIDGDSASIAELLAILSSLGGFPLRQDLGVTGSMSQHGEVQSIGGINEKIEGFFDVCALDGLSGTQGVLVPAANIRDLNLAPRVLDAIDAGRFHVWPVAHIDDALRLMTGRNPGKLRRDGTFTPGSVHARVAERLKRMADTGNRDT